MKTISATDAKNKFGDLMHIISSGTVAITKNNKVVAYITPAQQDELALEEAYLDKTLKEYSAGNISRKQVEITTKLWFGDILTEMAKRNLALPITDSKLKFNKEQYSLFNRIFHA